MAIFRTENSSVLWGLEDSWRVRATPNKRFGIHETLTAPDPSQDWYPFFGIASPRSRATILRGKWDMRGSLPDIKIQSGSGGHLADLLGLIIGRNSGGTVEEGLTDTDERVQSMTMQIAMRDTDGEYAFIREYYGGKVNRATLAATEGEELRLSLDEVIFGDVAHNLSGVAKNTGEVSLGSDPGPNSGGRFIFAGATLQIFGTVICRIKRFALSIDNQLEPKYYLCKAAGDPTHLTQIPNDIIEGKRKYQLEIELDVADIATDLELFKFLLNEGGEQGGATVGGLIVADFAVTPGEGGGTMNIEVGLSTSSSQPGPVVTQGKINIPPPPSGLFPSTWSIDVDRVRITVP